MSLNIRLVGPDEIRDPQVLAMLQAFYSRSYMPINQRLEDLNSDGEGETKEDKIKNAMQRYYVDYGHASIGEMGGCTVFIENVSMLAAKAIQDTPLYIGQECSTRYIDFSTQPFLLPRDVPAEDADTALLLLSDYRALYLDMLPKLFEYAKTKYPAELVVSSKVPEDKVAESHEQTCKAIAFDMARGLLPAGACTSLAWTGNFRTFNDHLRYLSFHPLAEVRKLASHIYSQLTQKYPSAFKNEVLNPNSWIGSAQDYYWTKAPARAEPDLLDVHQVFSGITPSQMKGQHYKYRTPADHSMYFSVEGLLDFGSFRDLQRHRNGMNAMPLLTLDYGMHSFYEDAYRVVAPELFEEAKVCYLTVAALQNKWELDDLQYLIPMGYQVPTRLYWSLGQMRYVLNLRTKTSVHPTLRKYMQQIGEQASNAMRDIGVEGYFTIHTEQDYEASDRGEQTIKKRV